MARLKKWVGTLLPILLTSCQGNTFYHSYQPVNEAGWDRNDTLTYILPTPVTAGMSLSIEIGIRHKDSYPYRDIWLTLNDDTCHLFLADTIGKWSGNGIGEMRHLTCSIPFQVKEDSIRQFRIQHIMEDNPLQGIHDIGIHISKKD